jgi:hypothetical protein
VVPGSAIGTVVITATCEPDGRVFKYYQVSTYLNCPTVIAQLLLPDCYCPTVIAQLLLPDCYCPTVIAQLLLQTFLQWKRVSCLCHETKDKNTFKPWRRDASVSGTEVPGSTPARV